MVELDNDVGNIIARMAGDSSAMDGFAGELEAKAKALAPVDKGNYARSIHAEKIPGKNGVTDRAVSTDDPNAVAIEFGHTARDGKTFVPGHFTLIKASRS